MRTKDSTKTFDVSGLSVSERQLLFLCNIIPGPHIVTMFRIFSGITGNATVGGNTCVDEILRSLETKGYLRYMQRKSEPNPSSFKRMYENARRIPIEDLVKLAEEAEKKGWWPTDHSFKSACTASAITNMPRDLRDQFEPWTKALYILTRDLRYLLLGRDKLSCDMDSEALLIAQYLVLCGGAGNLIRPEVGASWPVSFIIHLLEYAFIRNVDLRPTLAYLAEIVAGKPASWRGLSMLELGALCVWSGEIDALTRFMQCCPAESHEHAFLESLLWLTEEGRTSEVLEVWRELCVHDGWEVFEKQFVDSHARTPENTLAACRLLMIALMAQEEADAPLINSIAIAASPWPNLPLLKTLHGLAYHPIVGIVHHRMENLQAVFRPSDRLDPRAIQAKVEDPFGDILREQSIPVLIAMYLRRHCIMNSRGDHSTEKSRLQIIPASITETVVQKMLVAGYPTAASLLLRSLVGVTAHSDHADDILRQIRAAGGIDLTFVRDKAHSWLSVAAALRKVLPEFALAGRPRHERKMATGYFIWALRLAEVPNEPDEYELAAKGIKLFFRKAGERIPVPIENSENIPERYLAYLTSEDMRVIIALKRLYANWTRNYNAEALMAVTQHPHVARIVCHEGEEVSRGLQPITFRQANLAVTVDDREGGGMTLSIPEWSITTARTCHIRRVNDGEFVFYRLSREQRRIVSIFNSYGEAGVLVAPESSREMVRTLAMQLCGVMDIDGARGREIMEKSGLFRRIVCHATPIVRLTFSDKKELFVSLGIELCPEIPFRSPVTDHREEWADLNGEHVLLVRDGECESAALKPVRDILATCSAIEQTDVATYRLAAMADILSVVLRLQQVGPDIRVEWPEGTKFSITRVKSARISDCRTERDWFGIQGEFALESGKVLDMLTLLNAQKTRIGDYVQLSDGEFLHLSKALSRQLDAIRAAGNIQHDAIEVPPSSVLMLAKVFEETRDDGAAMPEALQEFSEKMAEEFSKPIAVPTTLKATLRPYQERGFMWLARHTACGFGACLADDMGLGKTVQIIALLLARASEGPTLVVAPASVCGNWRNELIRFAPSLNVVMSWSLEMETEKPFAALGPNDIIIISYGFLVHHENAFRTMTWNGVILDEAQAIKNQHSRRARIAKAIPAKFRIAATGTPVENGLMELWSLFEFLNPGLLGPSATFSERLTIPGVAGSMATATDGLKKLVEPFILRRLKENVLTDLPEKTEVTLTIDMGENERAAYEACRLHALEQLRGLEGNRISILAELTRLRRFCCHPSLVLPDFELSAKFDALSELLANLKANGHRALIFSQFTDCLALVRKLIDKKRDDAGQPWTYCYLDGTTPIAERSHLVADFQSGKGDFFLISLKAGGTGLNLTEANYVVLLDPWWNPAVENQAADRAHRIGQKNPVTVYRLIAANTVEEKVLKMHQDKQRIAEDVLEGTGSAHLTADMLMRLFEA